MAQTDDSTSLETVLELAKRLSPADKVRLIERVAPDIERVLADRPSTENRSLLGFLKGLGPAPSAEEIDGTRREMWADFPHSDV